MQSNDIFAKKPQEGGVWDVIVVGSGPAGLTASIYTTRGAASTLVLAGEKWGGQLMLTTTVDNFPGFPEGIEGPDLMEKMRMQAKRFGTEIVNQNINTVDFTKTPFELTSSTQKYLAKSVIIATGAETKWLNVPGEDRLIGRGISSCAPCDAPFFKDKKVVVIGGGDSAMEEALVLTKFAGEVTIIHRRDQFRASEAMQVKVKNNPKIKTLWNTQVKEFLGETKLEKIKLTDIKSNKEFELEIDGAFVAIGHNPSTSVFKGKINLDEKNYLLKAQNTRFKTQSNIPGVFVAGDVHDFLYRQAITAAGYGCQAAMDALNFLEKDPPSY